MIRLATVSPCYNEEAVLRHSVEQLTALFERMIAEGLISKDSMMVFVNDGSRDRTWEIIRELHAENPFVRGINMSRNVGHQNAIMAGMMTAREWADAVITLDADLQDDIECIPKMVKDYEDGYEIVYGVKVSRKADSFMKKFTAQTFYKLQSSMGVESVYNHADFRLMSRRALDMLSTYKERNLYLRGLIPMIGLKHTTVDDVISVLQGDEERVRAQYALNSTLFMFDEEAIINALQRYFDTADRTDIDNERKRAVDAIRKEFADKMKREQVIFNKQAKDDSRMMSIRLLRNYPRTGGIDRYLQFIADDGNPEPLRVIMAEALGWFNYSYRRADIIKGCQQLLNTPDLPELLRAELTQTINRLK